MIGLEFQDLEDQGPLLRYAAKQGFLSLLIASYLLEYHQIRVLAPLTTFLKGNPGKRRPAVLRVQPAATITQTGSGASSSTAIEMDVFMTCHTFRM